MSVPDGQLCLDREIIPYGFLYKQQSLKSLCQATQSSAIKTEHHVFTEYDLSTDEKQLCQENKFCSYYIKITEEDRG